MVKARRMGKRVLVSNCNHSYVLNFTPGVYPRNSLGIFLMLQVCTVLQKKDIFVTNLIYGVLFDPPGEPEFDDLDYSPRTRAAFPYMTFS